MVRQRVSIKEVAEEAGVSASTVSLVLNGKGRISQATRNRVVAATNALGYIADRTAARLRSGKSTLLGLVINDISNPFFAELCAEFETAAFQAGYLTIIANSNDNAETQRQLLDEMLGMGVAGIVTCPAMASTQESFVMLRQEQIPYIVCVRDVDDESADFIGGDDFRAGSLAARYLFELGHRNIAFIGGISDLSPWKGRVAGLRDVAENCGVQIRKKWIVQGPPTRRFGQEIGLTLLTRHPEISAIIAYNDLVASGLYRAAREAGRVVGDDISIIGIDNLPEAGSAVPPLSSVELFPRSTGKRAASLLVESINGERTERERIVLKPRLIVRASTSHLSKVSA